jgi:short-subunit dehydrogenase
MRTTTKLLAAASAAGLASAVMRRIRRPADLSGQVALITGASRGLGLLLARELAGRGCRVVICARNADDLAAAEADLVARGAEVMAVPCDLTERRQAEALVGQVTARFGRLDILVNNAGVIQGGPVTEMSADEFTTAVDLMLLAPVYVTLAALPYLRSTPAGRVVNITSIGGKVAVPHLLPYCAAKFGAVGFSQGLRAELSGRGVTVTTVVPGLMRTGSHLRAQFTGQAAKEYTWFAVLASAPLLSMGAERAARQIVAAAARGRSQLTLTPVAPVVTRIAGLAPATTSNVLTWARRLLPGPTTDQPTPTRTGQDIVAASPSRARAAMTVLGRRAAQRFQPAAPDG